MRRIRERTHSLPEPKPLFEDLVAHCVQHRELEKINPETSKQADYMITTLADEIVSRVLLQQGDAVALCDLAVTEYRKEKGIEVDEFSAKLRADVVISMMGKLLKQTMPALGANTVVFTKTAVNSSDHSSKM